MSVMLSIITVNYNDADGLLTTMQSVFEQQFSDYEYLIIDGGSTDQSLEYIKQHQDRITYWVSEPDQGVFHAQNKGIAAAEGDYLLFLNSGDYLTSPSALNDFVQHPSFKGDVVYGNYRFDEGGKEYPNDLSAYYFMRTSLPHQSTLFKRTVFEKMGSYDEDFKIAADRAFYIKCYMSGEFEFSHINYPLTHFDLGGISNDPELLEQKKQEDEAVFKKYFGDEYEPLKARREKEKADYFAQRNTVSGILKRIRRRLSK